MNLQHIDPRARGQSASGSEPSTGLVAESAASSATPVRSVLLTGKQAARDVYGVSERTFYEMRARGLVPAPVVLGPRLLRWVRADLEVAVANMPRQAAPGNEPTQLLRGRIERQKRTGVPA